MPEKILVIGIGNDFRCDDKIGLDVVRVLREKNIPKIKILEESGEGISLMEIWKNAESVFLIDAVSSNAEPGTIHRIDVHQQKIPKSFFHSSTHQFGVAEAVEISRVLKHLPTQLIIYCIEGKNFSMGTDVTPAVNDAGFRVVDLITVESRTNKVKI